MKKLSRTRFERVALTAAVFALGGFTATRPDPDEAEIVTSDVERFWVAFDDAAKAPLAERATVYRKEYFDPASQGFKDFIAFRRVTPAAFSEHVEQNRPYYATIRPRIREVVDQKPVIQADLRRLKALYPEITFPKQVYFVVGLQHGAGMNSDHGIILAAEMFATPPGTPYSYDKVYPEYVPFVVVHEIIHFNQTFQLDDHSTVLQGVVSEGTADFIASLVLREPGVRQSTDRWQYGCTHEAAVAARFAQDEDLTRMAPWLYDHAPDTGWPPDMGYWLGYRIGQALYHRSANRMDALRTMLRVTDFKALLEASGYPESRTACLPETPVPE